MAVASLRTHLIQELTDLLDAETQLTKALPKMAAAAKTKPLRAAFAKHLQETRGQIIRLNKALRHLGERPRRKTCEGMQGLLSEGESVMKRTPAGPLRDAVMITAAQKVEHYEMASYGTARTYARVLGEPAVARLLEQNLEEERAADGKLTTIAEGSVNQEAAEQWQAADFDDEGVVVRSAVWVGGTLGSASRQWSRSIRRAAAAVGVANERLQRRRTTPRNGTGRSRKATKHR